MYTILIAELKYQRNVSLTLLPVVFLASLAMGFSGVFEREIRAGLNIGYLLMFVMFLGFLLTNIMDPSIREKRDRFLVPLPVSIWKIAFGQRLFLVVNWLWYLLLYAVACLLAPEAIRWNREAAIALAAQSGMVFTILSFGNLHFAFAWPAFRRHDGRDLYKILTCIQMGLLWCQIYLLSIIQLLGLMDCFRQNRGTLLHTLYQTPGGAVSLLAAGLLLNCVLAALYARQRSFVQG